MAIIGFAKPANAFDALYKKAFISILEVESKVKQRDMDSFGFHVFLTLETIKLIENYYGVDIPKEIEDEILIGCIEEDYDIQGTANCARYSSIGNAAILTDIASLRCENHFDRFPGDTDGLNYGYLLGISNSLLKVETELNVSACVWAFNSAINNCDWTDAMSIKGSLRSWRILGHILHLLQDTGSPAHARGDNHMRGYDKDDYYETAIGDILFSGYVSKCTKKEIGLPDAPEIAGSTVQSYFDTMQKFTSRNFFSNDTMFTNFHHDVNLPFDGVSSYGTKDDPYIRNNIGKPEKCIIAQYNPDNAKQVKDYWKYFKFPTTWEEAQTYAKMDIIVMAGVDDFLKNATPRIVGLCAGLMGKFMQDVGLDVDNPIWLASIIVDNNYTDSEDSDGDYDFKHIQAAINAATDGDTIIVHQGTYAENINFEGKAITIKSINPDDMAIVSSTIIDGGQAGSVVTFSSGEGNSSVLCGVTAQNGNTDLDGGGIHCKGSSPVISNCFITKNTSKAGPGGISCLASSYPKIFNCIIYSNTSKFEVGGILCDRSSPVITNCIISNNYNFAFSGGGINCRYSSPTIMNCTFSKNSAGYCGDGGTYGDSICCISSFPKLTNCILWDNGANEIYTYDSTPVITYSNIQGGYNGKGNINLDPKFIDVDNFHLQSASPCIDKGTSEGAPDKDKDGINRSQDGNCDMGAYEYVILDHDGDGIVDALDQSPNEYSNNFSDGTTSGKIIARGDQALIIKDEADSLGIRIKADPSGGALPAIINVCGGSAISLDAGDEIIVTCGSVKVLVISGIINITFTSNDGVSATTSMNTGDSLVFNQCDFTFTALSTNPASIIIKVQGKEFSIEPGETITISKNAYSVPLSSNPISIILLVMGVISIMGLSLNGVFASF